MKARLAAVVALLLCIAPPASAHRLDEFLQATTIAVEPDRVTAQMRLTPGVAVAATILAGLDTDGDGQISDAEQRAYAERLLRDLSLTVDDHRLPLCLVSSAFPTVEEMRAGSGEILLTYRAAIPAGGSSRKLTFENHHQSAVSAYLVNCLFPNDPGIHVTAQSRNYEQTFYQVDYAQTTGIRPSLGLAAAVPTIRETDNRSSPPPRFQAASQHRMSPSFTDVTERILLGALAMISALAGGTRWWWRMERNVGEPSRDFQAGRR